MTTKQRCNHCMTIQAEELTECEKCGKDDALMCPFETNHTPTPWIVTTDSSGFTAINNHNNFRSDFPLATMCKGMTEAEANAAFIVKAVNCHDELVAALIELDQAFQSELGANYPEGTFDIVQKALAKAKGDA